MPQDLLFLPEEGFVRLPTVLAHVGCKRSTLWFWVAKSQFPKPIKLSPRVTVWEARSVREWIASHSEQPRLVKEAE